MARRNKGAANRDTSRPDGDESRISGSDGAGDPTNEQRPASSIDGSTDTNDNVIRPNSSDVEIVSPGDATSASDSDSARNSSSNRADKRRASASTSTNASTEPNRSSKKKTVFVEKTLYSVFLMLAHLTKIEELAIPQDEVKLLSEAIAEISAYYKTVISPRMDAWGNLAIVAIGIFAPRAIAIYQQISKKGQKQNDNSGQ